MDRSARIHSCHCGYDTKCANLCLADSNKGAAPVIRLSANQTELSCSQNTKLGFRRIQPF